MGAARWHCVEMGVAVSVALVAVALVGAGVFQPQAWRINDVKNICAIVSTSENEGVMCCKV